jgi:hypothetical protein
MPRSMYDLVSEKQQYLVAWSSYGIYDVSVRQIDRLKPKSTSNQRTSLMHYFFTHGDLISA